MLAMDVSRSMKADDVEPTRLDGARRGKGLPGRRSRDPSSVSSRSRRGRPSAPPTEDRALVNARSTRSSLVRARRSVTRSRSLSASGSATARWSRRSRGRSSSSRTAPRTEGGSPAAAIEEAKERGVPGVHRPRRHAGGSRRGGAARWLQADHPGADEPRDPRAAGRGDRGEYFAASTPSSCAASDGSAVSGRRRNSARSPTCSRRAQRRSC